MPLSTFTVEEKNRVQGITMLEQWFAGEITRLRNMAAVVCRQKKSCTTILRWHFTVLSTKLARKGFHNGVAGDSFTGRVHLKF